MIDFTGEPGFALLLFLASCLGNYRLARAVSKEKGFMHIFDRVRKIFGKLAAGTKPGSFRHTFAEGVHCPLCTGFWFAIIPAVLLFPSQWVLFWFAIAGGQALLQVVENVA